MEQQSHSHRMDSALQTACLADAASDDATGFLEEVCINKQVLVIKLTETALTTYN